MMKVKLLTNVEHPARWVSNRPKYKAGQWVSVIPATNQPDSEGKYWIDEPELEDDPYGILLEPGDYAA